MTIKELEENLKGIDDDFSIVEDKETSGRYIVRHGGMEAIILNYDEFRPWAELDWPRDIYYEDVDIISCALNEIEDWLSYAEN